MFALAYIVIGGCFEPVWVFALEKADSSEGRRMMGFYAIALTCMFLSIFFLSFAMRTMSVGVSYAIWTAVGSILTLIISKIFYNEMFKPLKIVGIMMILIGITGLELAGGL
ncbi:MAG: EamA family transporter [Candidatus Methanomethylophilus sp.]|jgi:multidrug transporter EmrE-like cation transporter|nr:small multidrug resistance protein [methanogenic archaeon ISO4-H5]MBO5519293.1 EamA family transporter [Methanomethylophilus sp.]MBO5599439.1 EamA family transporter [Methanomethylophilus sp.]MEE3363092.1 SMR family transporter [Methanomethylophilus sp.]